tara:strand:- start:405 stop:953 length:549 start_codon:yes stop_codon:yes gene_type:complete
MRKLWALLLVCAISLPVSASQGGVNESISLDGTGIKTLDYDEVMRTNNESSDFGVILQMEDGSNISNIRWVTQVCINTGVCYPPEESQMNRDSDGLFESHLDTESGYSYINWKFIIEMENGSESHVPDVGFGWRVWSDCWFDNGTWGGSETSCKGGDSALSGFTIPLAMASTAMAALMTRRY